MGCANNTEEFLENCAVVPTSSPLPKHAPSLVISKPTTAPGQTQTMPTISRLCGSKQGKKYFDVMHKDLLHYTGAV